MENLILDSVFLSKSTGAINWTKSEITPTGEKVSHEWLIYVPAEDPQFETVVNWLKAIGRL
jgi:hypothetical protein